jgi:3-hydroxyacyl-[acyl-carrier-protein] dehydratase
LKRNKTGGFDIEEILKILPHRYPFVLVDRVLELTEPRDGTRAGRVIKARKCVSFNEAFFSGHFPHRPVMPGVLIIEALAQTGAICCWRPSDHAMDVAIGRMSEARFRRPVTPGDVLDMHAEVVKDRGGMVVIKAQAFVDGELVTEVEILAAMSPVKDQHKGEAAR